MDGDTIYWTVDRKPKRTPEIKRLVNIRANPNVEVIVDRYEERWDRIWWIRAAGPARVVESDEEAGRALDLLAEKYPQYRTNPPPGPVVAIQLARLAWWEGGPAPAPS
jgi:PPOX class probable F420-dependent enzyme